MAQSAYLFVEPFLRKKPYRCEKDWGTEGNAIPQYIVTRKGNLCCFWRCPRSYFSTLLINVSQLFHLANVPRHKWCHDPGYWTHQGQLLPLYRGWANVSECHGEKNEERCFKFMHSMLYYNNTTKFSQSGRLCTGDEERYCLSQMSTTILFPNQH